MKIEANPSAEQVKWFLLLLALLLGVGHEQIAALVL